MSSRRILVADDNEDLQKVIRRVAEARGYEVFQATNGHDTCSLAAEVRPDVIVLDIGLPGLDGRDVLTRLKRNEQTSEIPVVVCSGREPQSDRPVALELGAEDYVEKPVDAGSLLRKLERVLLRTRDALRS